MKTSLILIVAALAGASGAHATTIDLGFFAVSPQGNFLYDSPGDNCMASYAVAGCSMAPDIINLFNYGVKIGDTIQITDVGGLCVFSGSNCTVYPASSSYLGGIFSPTGNVLASTFQDRVPDGVAVVPTIPNISTSNLNSLGNGTVTTIANDFYLGATVVVAAQYLIVGTLDSAYADNSVGTCNTATTNCFGVDIKDLTFTSTAPEPGSAALLLTGIGGLWAFRRKFAKRA